MSEPWNLLSDVPLSDPTDDAFGYAPFASRLAAAIVDNPTPRGLVLAVHGEWGSGKSTMLNFVKYSLASRSEPQRPVLIHFNPWWFEGREQIATQLLDQFSAQLPDRLKHVRALARLVGRYSKQIADAAADVSGWGWLKKPLGWLFGWIPGLSILTEKTDIPSIKRKVEAALKSSGKRFVVLVDDIDRLTPAEALDLFRAVKALADFPEVVYVLFFDRDAVGKAIGAPLSMDGEAYLEKIVQAPFHLPAVDKVQLRQKLLQGLDAIITSKPQPFPLDQGRWSEVYFEGVDRFIRKPRDIVRALNAISVAYPPVAGEVNPVDFIALEFLRVFRPAIYNGIRDSKDLFCGSAARLGFDKDRETKLFERWRDALPTDDRDWVPTLVGRLFPRVSKALRGESFEFEDRADWRSRLRPCSPDCFDVYFQFGVPANHVSRAELELLLAEESAERMAVLFVEASAHLFPDKHSKARDLIDRLDDFDDLIPEQAARLIEALVDCGHVALRIDDEKGGFFSYPNRWRISNLINKLLTRLDLGEREALLLRLAEASPGLWLLVDLADNAARSKKDPSKGPSALVELHDGFAETMASLVGKRLDLASLGELMSMPELDYIVHRWQQWGDGNRIAEVFAPMLDDDEHLIALIDKFVRTGSRSSGRETTETYELSMKALALAIDIKAAEPQIQAMNARGGWDTRKQATIERFIVKAKRLAEGQEPDRSGFDEDD